MWGPMGSAAEMQHAFEQSRAIQEQSATIFGLTAVLSSKQKLSRGFGVKLWLLELVESITHD